MCACAIMRIQSHRSKGKIEQSIGRGRSGRTGSMTRPRFRLGIRELMACRLPAVSTAPGCVRSWSPPPVCLGLCAAARSVPKFEQSACELRDVGRTRYPYASHAPYLKQGLASAHRGRKTRMAWVALATSRNCHPIPIQRHRLAQSTTDSSW